MKKTEAPTAILNPAGQPVLPVPTIPPAPRLSTIRSKKLMLFNNTKLNYGNSMAVFDRLHDLLLQEGAKEVLRVTINPVRVPREEVVALLKENRPQGLIVALCDSGGITDYTIVDMAYEGERMGIPTVVLTAKSMANLSAMIAHQIMPHLALVELDDPIWPLEKEELWRRTEKIYPEVLKGLTLRRDQFKREFDLRVNYATMLTYPEGRFLDETLVSGDLTDQAIYEKFCDWHLCDGLPIVPPTLARVEAMVQYCDREREDAVVPSIAPSWCPVTVEKLAINAVMAGCKPEYFPVIITAYEAMATREFDLGPTVSTTYNGGHLVLVSGPFAEIIGLQSAAGCLGPGFRANATIGRAIALSNMNILRAFPGGADVATFGSPAKYTYCFAESLKENPWKKGKEQKETYVTVFKCETPHNIMDHKSVTPEGILLGIASEASSLGGNNCSWLGDLFVLLSPDHSKIIYNAGWKEDDIKLFLYDHARNPIEKVSERGINPRWEKWMRSSLNGMMPVVLGPEDIRVVVAGGGGPHSMVFKPWGLISRAVTRRVRTISVTSRP
jgi:hypothetical protein